MPFVMMHPFKVFFLLASVAIINAQLPPNFEQDLQESLRPLQNIGQNVQNQVNQQTQGLQFLSQNIQNQVQQGLKPVYIMKAKMDIRQGNGGTTIVTYHPSNRVFINKNGEKFECKNGAIGSNHQCTGDLVPFIAKSDQDYCFRQENYIQANDKICFPTSSDGVSINVINDRFKCTNNDGTPGHIVTVQKYKELCKNDAATITYNYYTNGEFTNPDNALNCVVNGPTTHCTLTETVLEATSNGPHINTGGGAGGVHNLVIG